VFSELITFKNSPDLLKMQDVRQKNTEKEAFFIEKSRSLRYCNEIHKIFICE